MSEKEKNVTRTCNRFQSPFSMQKNTALEMTNDDAVFCFLSFNFFWTLNKNFSLNDTVNIESNRILFVSFRYCSTTATHSSDSRWFDRQKFSERKSEAKWTNKSFQKWNTCTRNSTFCYISHGCPKWITHTHRQSHKMSVIMVANENK